MSRTKKKRTPAPRFDWETLWLGLGVGLGCIAIGALIAWATFTAPAGPSAASASLNASQRLARLLPHALQARIALGLGVLMALFGLTVFAMGLWTAVRFVFSRLFGHSP